MLHLHFLCSSFALATGHLSANTCGWSKSSCTMGCWLVWPSMGIMVSAVFLDRFFLGLTAVHLSLIDRSPWHSCKLGFVIVVPSAAAGLLALWNGAGESTISSSITSVWSEPSSCGVAVFGCGKGVFPDIMLLMCTVVILIAGAFFPWELFEELSLPWLCPNKI